MSTEENKAIVRRYYEEGWNQKNAAVRDELISPDLVYHSPLGSAGDKAELYKGVITGFLTAFPDVQVTIDEMIAEGDQVAVAVTSSGTHSGETPNHPPTGKAYKATSISIFTLKDGKIVSQRIDFDAQTFRDQMAQ